MLKAVSLNAEDTSECTADEDRNEKERALLNQPPEYGQGTNSIEQIFA